ncbi:MAG: hypothetical protein N4A45_04355 [Flavobacteriales bacterium]|nr:hypothetical protein [Flavobacteriales bacterium]
MKINKKILFGGIFILAISLQSCCITDSCPGVTKVEKKVEQQKMDC